jgi:Flp pilus assembly protein TadB
MTKIEVDQNLFLWWILKLIIIFVTIHYQQVVLIHQIRLPCFLDNANGSLHNGIHSLDVIDKAVNRLSEDVGSIPILFM